MKIFNGYNHFRYIESTRKKIVRDVIIISNVNAREKKKYDNKGTGGRKQGREDNTNN